MSSVDIFPPAETEKGQYPDEQDTRRQSTLLLLLELLKHDILKIAGIIPPQFIDAYKDLKIQRPGYRGYTVQRNHGYENGNPNLHQETYIGRKERRMRGDGRIVSH